MDGKKIELPNIGRSANLLLRELPNIGCICVRMSTGMYLLDGFSGVNIFVLVLTPCPTPQIRFENEIVRTIFHHVIGSVVDPNLFFSGSGSYLDLNFGSGFGFESGSGLFTKNT
jgi:hypothetical protein